MLTWMQALKSWRRQASRSCALPCGMCTTRGSSFLPGRLQPPSPGPSLGSMPSISRTWKPPRSKRAALRMSMKSPAGCRSRRRSLTMDESNYSLIPAMPPFSTADRMSCSPTWWDICARISRRSSPEIISPPWHSCSATGSTKKLCNCCASGSGKKQVATCLGFGPRFLHSTGQDYKGGPNTGVFLQITAGHARDLAIPNQKYTFGVVIDAQAAGDLKVLQQRQRRALRAHLGTDVEAGFGYLADAVEKALR